MIEAKDIQGKTAEELQSLMLKLVDSYQSEILSWKEKYNLLLEQFKLAQQQRFAHSSEKCPEQAELFDEADAPPPSGTDNSKAITIAEHQRQQTSKPKREAIPEHFERERIEYDVPESEKTCRCGCQMQRIGEEISEQMEVIPPQFMVKQHVRPKYACKRCEDGVVIAPMPKLFLPKSMAGPSLVAYTIANKYIDHLPLYRQEGI